MIDTMMNDNNKSNIPLHHTNVNTIDHNHHNTTTVAGDHDNNNNHNNNNNVDDDSSFMLCESCVNHLLSDSYQRRQIAYQDWLIARKKCSDCFSSRSNGDNNHHENSRTNDVTTTNNKKYLYHQLMEWNYQRKELCKKIDLLKQENSNKSLRVYQMKMNNDEYENTIHEQSNVVQYHLEQLNRMKQSLLSITTTNTTTNTTSSSSSTTTTAEPLDRNGNEYNKEKSSPQDNVSNNDNKMDAENSTATSSNVETTTTTMILPAMLQSIHDTKHRIQQIRFRYAIQAFMMHKLQVETPAAAATTTAAADGNANHPNALPKQQQRHHQRRQRTVVTGIGKINGLPLPNKGPELFSFLPSSELQSALKLVASLTSIVAKCLAIPLPHPIVFHPNDINDIIQKNNKHKSSIAVVVSPTTNTVMGNHRHQPKNHDDDDDTIRGCYEYTDDIATIGAAAVLYHPDRRGPDHHRYHHHNMTSPNHDYHPQYYLENHLSSKPIHRSIPTNDSASVTTTTTSGGTGLSSILYSGQRLLREVSQSVSTATVGHLSSPPQQQQKHSSSIAANISMDPEQVQKRLYYSSCAILAEDHTCSTTYSLRLVKNTTLGNNIKTTNTVTTATTATLQQQSTSEPLHGRPSSQSNESNQHGTNSSHPSTTTTTTTTTTPIGHNTITTTSIPADHDEFSIALQLLQNNIIALCIRSGVPVDQLWPAVAMLLNLHELYQFLFSSISSTTIATEG